MDDLYRFNHSPHDPQVALHILVVDYNEEDLRNSMNVVSHSGHIAEGVRTGAEALEAAYRIPFDMMLLEINLPAMSGFETAVAVRDLPEGRGTLPIIALSDTRDPEDVRKTFQMGMNNFILKPLTKSNLHAATISYSIKKRKISDRFKY